jgi:hypothetical protein
MALSRYEFECSKCKGQLHIKTEDGSALIPVLSEASCPICNGITNIPYRLPSKEIQKEEVKKETTFYALRKTHEPDEETTDPILALEKLVNGWSVEVIKNV